MDRERRGRHQPTRVARAGNRVLAIEERGGAQGSRGHGAVLNQPRPRAPWQERSIDGRRAHGPRTRIIGLMRQATSSHPLDLLWFCQLAADGEFIGTIPERRPTLEYISSLVETAAEMGFSSLLTATNFHAENEAWTASIATLARTRGAGLLIAVRPGMFHPAIFAKMVATAANLFPGRVRINVVTGSNPAENAMYGDTESHAQRYARTREFIAIMRELWRGEPVDHDSPRYPFKGAIVSPVPPEPVPIYLGGHSAEAQRIAAE